MTTKSRHYLLCRIVFLWPSCPSCLEEATSTRHPSRWVQPGGSPPLLQIWLADQPATQTAEQFYKRRKATAAAQQQRAGRHCLWHSVQIKVSGHTNTEWDKNKIHVGTDKTKCFKLKTGEMLLVGSTVIRTSHVWNDPGWWDEAFSTVFNWSTRLIREQK